MLTKNPLTSIQSFFNRPTKKQLMLLEQTTPLLESFMKMKQETVHQPLIVLTDLSIAIQELEGSEYRTTLVKEFSRDLKFQKIIKKEDS